MEESKKMLPEEENSKYIIVNEKITAERFVVFLDIMGFKDRVGRTNHEDLKQLLSDFNNDITNLIGKHRGKNNIQLAQFSDSIVLFSGDATKESLLLVATIACEIMAKAIELGIPLKGAISEGKMTCDMTKQLFFGQALIDAYLLEENVQYYGVVAHHSVEKMILESGEKNLFRDIKVPLKSGSISHFELAWYRVTREVEHIIEKLNDIRQTVSDAPRKYIDNTLDIINSDTLYY